MVIVENENRMILAKLTCKEEKETLEETVRIIKDAYEFDENTVVYVHDEEKYKFLLKRCLEHMIRIEKKVRFKGF